MCTFVIHFTTFQIGSHNIGVYVDSFNQLRTHCGQAGKQIQCTIVTTVDETAENFNQEEHHSIEALSETETMHAST